MTWFKVDDHLHAHSKKDRAGMAAMGLWVVAGSWSAAYLTDGYVPGKKLRALGGTPAQAQRLVDVGLWEPLGDGWQFHGWAEYQPSRQTVLDQRERSAERLRRWREEHRAG